MNEAEKAYKSKGTVTVKVTIPLLLWEEWNIDCEQKYGGARYMKMMHDHEFVQNHKALYGLFNSQIQQLEAEVAELRELITSKEDSGEPEKKQKTFGGNE